MMKKILYISLTTIVVLVLSSLLWWKRPQYEYVHPKMGSIIEAIYGLGKVKTHHQYDVKVNIVSHIEKIYVKEGQMVKKKDPLVLLEGGLLFKTPYDGTVTNVAFNEYDIVTPQVSLITVQDMSDKYIEVSLDQEGVLRVKKGQKAIILFEGLRAEKYYSQVNAVFPKHDEFLAHLELNQPIDSVLPGMTADISIIVSEDKNSLLVPVAGISNGHVLVRRANGKKEKVPIKIGGVDGEWAQVLEGDVSEEDEVIIRIQHRNPS